MKVAIIGGGNIGTLMAAELSSAGYEIAVYTSKPHLWSKEIEVYDAENTLLLKSHISMATDDLSTAVTGAEYVFVTVPAQLFGSTSEKLLPHLQKGTKLGIIPGSGGAEFAFLNLIEKASENKSKTETFISKFSKYYTLLVVICHKLYY